MSLFLNQITHHLSAPIFYHVITKVFLELFMRYWNLFSSCDFVCFVRRVG